MCGDRVHLRLLGLFQILAGAAIVPFVLTGLGETWAVKACALLWLGLGVTTLLLANRLPASALEGSLYASALVVSLHCVTTPRPPMQVLDGLELLVLGMFAAFTLSHRRIWAWLIVSSLCYLVGLAINPLPNAAWLGPVILIMVAGTTTVVRGLIEQVQAASRHDPLTGALNRLGLAEEGDLVAAMAARSRVPVTVAFLDLDRFKDFNDSHGHAAGDQLLVDFVAALRHQVRRTDLVSRVGGDEFVLILPGVDVPQAHRVMHRLRTALPIDSSYGLSHWPPGTSLEHAMDAADRQMYEYKALQFRNRRPCADTSDPR